MAASQPSVEPVNQLDRWLQSCDICMGIAVSPVEINCGHLFCLSCLNGAFQEQQARPCPVCTADLLELETAHSFPNHGSEGPAGPTIEAASSDAAIPDARPPPPARASLISNARMDVVRDHLNKEKDHAHAMLLNVSRHMSDMRGNRIRELEQVVDNLVQMNLALLREMEDREQDRRRMSRRIAELENPIVRGVGVFAMRHTRFGRRITPTQIAGENEEPVPESVEDGLLPTDNDVVGTSRGTARNRSDEATELYIQSRLQSDAIFHSLGRFHHPC